MLLGRGVLAALGLGFFILIIWAIGSESIFSFGSELLAKPWGVVTLADLYLGFLLSAVVIGLFEKPLPAIFWILPIFFLGNVWTVIWFVFRLPVLARKLRAE